MNEGERANNKTKDEPEKNKQENNNEKFWIFRLMYIKTVQLSWWVRTQNGFHVCFYWAVSSRTKTVNNTIINTF